MEIGDSLLSGLNYLPDDIPERPRQLFSAKHGRKLQQQRRPLVRGNSIPNAEDDLIWWEKQWRYRADAKQDNPFRTYHEEIIQTASYIRQLIEIDSGSLKPSSYQMEQVGLYSLRHQVPAGTKRPGSTSDSGALQGAYKHQQPLISQSIEELARLQF